MCPSALVVFLREDGIYCFLIRLGCWVLFFGWFAFAVLVVQVVTNRYIAEGGVVTFRTRSIAALFLVLPSAKLSPRGVLHIQYTYTKRRYTNNLKTNTETPKDNTLHKKTAQLKKQREIYQFTNLQPKKVCCG